MISSSSLFYLTALSLSFLGMAKESLEHGHVIPDVLDHFDSKVDVIVDYGNIRVSNGAQLDPHNQTVHMPYVSLDGSVQGKYYTLVMSDPDAPSPEKPTHREYVHWIVSNIPGDESNIAEGEQVLAYAPPSPPKGDHQNVISIFEQPQP